MAISQEKVCGWLVYYGSGEVGQYPHNVIELEVIPEVWELYVVKYPDNFDTSEYYGFFAWKRELSFDEKRSAGRLTKQIQDLSDDFTKFQEYCLKNWNDFCAEYKHLPPERIQAAKKFCVLDSVPTPAAPSDPVEYVLDFAVQNKSGNVWPGVVILGPLASPSGFMKALETNISLREIIKRSLGKNASGGFEHVEIQERGKYFEQHPERRFNSQIIPELADFVKAYNAGGSQAALASGSSLVSSDPVPAVPADSVLEDVTAFIYDGITKEIKAPVRDSKRKTTLTELEKTNAKLDSIDEKIVRLDEKIERLDEKTEQIHKNAERIPREIIERIEHKWNINVRRFWQYEILGLGPEEIWEWENPGRTLKGLNAEEKKPELAPIYTSLNRARDKEESKKGKR
ncbi:MAG: hypothetical protein IJQ31_11185 [Thermoguttaceae bacterium]|nr:hypothetical protein [Thermoguttaceae bacterium]